MTAKRSVFHCNGTQYVPTRPMQGTRTVKVVLSQSMCLYQFPQVMGVSEMCTLRISYLFPRMGLKSVVPSGKASAWPLGPVGTTIEEEDDDDMAGCVMHEGASWPDFVEPQMKKWQ